MNLINISDWLSYGNTKLETPVPYKITEVKKFGSLEQLQDFTNSVPDSGS